MSDPKTLVAQRLHEAKAELAQLKSEKLKLFPPNPHPFAQSDAFPANATRDQVAKRNALIARIEELERLIKELGGD
jgi:hypothetical protein